MLPSPRDEHGRAGRRPGGRGRDTAALFPASPWARRDDRRLEPLPPCLPGRTRPFLHLPCRPARGALRRRQQLRTSPSPSPYVNATAFWRWPAVPCGSGCGANRVAHRCHPVLMPVEWTGWILEGFRSPATKRPSDELCGAGAGEHARNPSDERAWKRCHAWWLVVSKYTRDRLVGKRSNVVVGPSGWP